MSRLPEPETGTVTFEMLAEIAAGATARVDLCRALSPPEKAGRLLAVKRLHPHIAEDPQFADMFFDEVWLSASLRHKNVAEVAGWGTDEQGTFLAVELVQGVSLSRLMKTVFDTGEVFSERMIVYIAVQLCQGLAAAHDLRSADGELLHLVHRDLTPGNILCGFDGTIKITDFGLAKAKQRVTKTLTGLLKGSPQYMSPEQSRGQEIDGRADLFSLGVVFFELFAGKRPWSGKNELQVMHEAQSEPPLDLFQLRPRIDKELVAVVTKLLEKAPADRFQSAHEVGERMQHWLVAHGYRDGNQEALARFVRRNAMRQMRWFERAIAGEITVMPDSMRPSRRADRLSNPPPARLSSLSNAGRPGGVMQRGAAPQLPRRAGSSPGTLPGSVSSSPPRVRARSRKPLDSETTDVTDAAAKVAVLHAELDDVETKKSRSGAEGEGELGDEIPTLVQKENRPTSHYRARAREVGAPRAVAATSAEIARLIVDEDSDQRTTAVKSREHGDALVGDRSIHKPAPSLDDHESEEIPTVPMKGKRAVAQAIQRAVASASKLPGEIVPPSPGVPPPPVRPVSPPAPEPTGGARRVPPDADERFLLGESDRLALDAVRYNEESKAAAALAVRRATVAKLANEASMLAAEAVRVASVAGIAEAARKLEQAYAIEESLRQAVASAPPSSVPPPPDGPAPLRLPGPATDPFARHPGEGRISAPPDGFRTSVPPDPFGGSHGAEGYLAAAPTDGFSVSGELARPSLFDPGSFRSRLRPTVLGMPTLVALALAAFGVGALVVVLVIIVT